jgi:hypothetical protein
MVEIHKPPNEKIIGHVYVGLSEDAQGRNGICASMVPGLGAAPMVTASDKVLEFFKDQADDLATQIGMPIKIYRFIRVEVVHEAKP